MEMSDSDSSNSFTISEPSEDYDVFKIPFVLPTHPNLDQHSIHDMPKLSDSFSNREYWADYVSGPSHAFRVPFVSSICPHPSPDETLFALQVANESRPVHKRFPIEILLLINSKVHENAIYECVRSIWTPDTTRSSWPGGVWADETALAKDGQTYTISKESDFLKRVRKHYYQGGIYSGSVSAADLLYRVRCFFPEVMINISPTGSDGYRSIWHAGVQHNETGVIFYFSEIRIGAQVRPILVSGHSTPTKLARRAFITDTKRLLNALFETVDGKHFAYYHPAAEADLPTVDEHFLAVPNRMRRDRVKNGLDEDRGGNPYAWQPVAISAADISSFKSLLPGLKYNIESRKVDPINGTTALTTIISSSWLFYRLLCHFTWKHNNANSTLMSVWQVKLEHMAKEVSVIFMDDRGLFDIRADEEGAGDAMKDLVALVDELCSDNYTQLRNDAWALDLAKRPPAFIAEVKQEAGVAYCDYETLTNEEKTRVNEASKNVLRTFYRTRHSRNVG